LSASTNPITGTTAASDSATVLPRSDGPAKTVRARFPKRTSDSTAWSSITTTPPTP
jgi:hypothetical protein